MVVSDTTETPMTPTQSHRRLGLVATALLAVFGAVGCMRPDAIAPTLDHQRVGVAALTESYGHDLQLLRELVEHILAQRRVLLAGELHREFVRSGYIVAGPAADVDAFVRDCADAKAETTLVHAVRDGRMTKQQAQDFLLDYALAMRLSDSRGLRLHMLAELEPLQAHDAAASDTLHALQHHVETTASLLHELHASNSVLQTFASAVPTVTAPARSDIEVLLRRTVLTQIEDDERRERAAAALIAAMDLLDTFSGDAP
jgi:hypothetical protein